jgi:Zn-dependent protease
MTGLLKKGIVRTLAGYVKREVGPRTSELLWSQHTLIAAVTGIAVALGASRITGAPKVADIALGFLAYAAIALGFCVAGITISLTLPDLEFLQKLSKCEIEGKEGNALSGLLFVFTWAGTIHWLCLVNMIVVLLLDGGNQNPFTKDATVWRQLWIGATTMLATYALETFLITVLTLGHVGRTFIDDLRSKESDRRIG